MEFDVSLKKGGCSDGFSRTGFGVDALTPLLPHRPTNEVRRCNMSLVRSAATEESLKQKRDELNKVR